MDNKIIAAPEINAEFKETTPSSTSPSSDLTISEEQYATLSECTNNEQLAKLRCWDIQEYMDGITAQRKQLDDAYDAALAQLSSAKSDLITARTDLKACFDTVFTPLGLANKVVSVTQTSPHIVTVQEDGAPAVESASEEE